MNYLFSCRQPQPTLEDAGSCSLAPFGKAAGPPSWHVVVFASNLVMPDVLDYKVPSFADISTHSSLWIFHNFSLFPWNSSSFRSSWNSLSPFISSDGCYDKKWIPTRWILLDRKEGEKYAKGCFPWQLPFLVMFISALGPSFNHWWSGSFTQ